MESKLTKAKLKLLNKIMDNLDNDVAPHEMRTYAEILEKLSNEQLLNVLFEAIKDIGVTNDTRRNDYAIFGR